ncbi:HAMP domain-containing histidine kinase [bacterium]|nr:HAMP domain-containing histidine kinase [bacterium]
MGGAVDIRDMRLREYTKGLLVVASLATALITAAVSIVVVLVRVARSQDELRGETGEITLLSSLQNSALSTIGYTNQIVRMGSAGFAGIDTNDTAAVPSGGELDAKTVDGAVAFRSTTAALRELLSDEETIAALEVTSEIYERYTASILELAQIRLQGGEAMELYHGTTTALEQELSRAIEAMRLLQGEHLSTVLALSQSAQSALLWQVPVLSILALFILAALVWRHQAHRREELESLQRLDREKDRFIASVGHELRTPLTSVLGFVDVLRNDVGGFQPGEREELLEVVARETWDLASIVEDLLVAVRVRTGDLSVVAVPVNLVAQTAQVLEGLEMTVAVDGDPGPAIGDPARIRQILRNLVTNAQRYGGPNVRVDCANRGDIAAVSVVDDGLGVPAEDQDRIFEPYQQVDAGVNSPGTVGLGLAVARHLAQMMGGDLVYRRDDDHSVFELTLPVGAAHREPIGATLASVA